MQVRSRVSVVRPFLLEIPGLSLGLGFGLCLQFGVSELSQGPRVPEPKSLPAVPEAPGLDPKPGNPRLLGSRRR